MQTLGFSHATIVNRHIGGLESILMYHHYQKAIHRHIGGLEIINIHQ